MLIGLVTNFEHGFWLARDIKKVIYGRPDGSYRNDYNDIMWHYVHEEQKLESFIYTDLETVLVKSMELATQRHNYQNELINININGSKI